MIGGFNLEPITISVLKGLLSGSIDGVNMVNAPYLAKERGVEVTESKSSDVKEYTNTIQVQVITKDEDRSITGSIFGKGDPRIVKFDEYYFEAVLSRHMLVLNNMDVPGVIGKVGNILGENKVNIAGFHLGRLAESGKAMAVINVDSPPTSETLKELRETPNVLNVHSVTL